MAHCYGDPIPLVPGADWGFRVATLNEDGSALNVSTWTVASAKVEWSGGAIEVDVDLSDAGWAAVSASDADTATLPYGKVSKLTVWAQSPGGEDRPIVFKEVDGRRFVGAADATVQILGAQGNPGVNWRGDWSLALGQVVIDDGVLNDGSSYRCIAPHTASADNEPGVGVDWEDYWAVLALGFPPPPSLTFNAAFNSQYLPLVF